MLAEGSRRFERIYEQCTDTTQFHPLTGYNPPGLAKPLHLPLCLQAQQLFPQAYLQYYELGKVPAGFFDHLVRLK